MTRNEKLQQELQSYYSSTFGYNSVSHDTRVANKAFLAGVAWTIEEVFSFLKGQKPFDWVAWDKVEDDFLKTLKKEQL